MKMETSQVKLRPFQETDLADFYAYTKIPGLGEAAGWRHAGSLAEAEAMLQNLLNNQQTYAIEEKQTLQVIGHITVHDDSEDHDPQIKELGFVLHPDFQRRGIMKSVVALVLTEVFSQQVTKVYACCFTENQASQNLIEGLGFQFEQAGSYSSPSLQKTFSSNEYFMTKSHWEDLHILYERADFKISSLTQANAEMIANQWHYPADYAFYDLSADPEDYEEMMDAKQRGDSYYQVIKAGELFGYFVLEPAENSDEIIFGLGMRPALTGQGFGKEFFQLILAFIQENYAVKRINLAVAEFNTRAQKLYQNVGFVKTGEYLQATNGDHYPFVTMQLDLTL
ncbi:GNAT family N-acetyltransferase [Enterococcus sp. LJL90]